MPFVAHVGPGPNDYANTPKTSVTLVQMPKDGQHQKLWFQVPDRFGWTNQLGTAPWAPDRVGAVGPVDTDLASIPPFLWGLIPSYGRQTMPAILHDLQCVAADEVGAGPGGRRQRARVRRDADELFRTSLGDSGVGVVTRWVMWIAVRLFGSMRIALTVLLGIGVGLFHWSAPLFKAVSDSLGGLTIWPWLRFLEFIPRAIAWVLERFATWLEPSVPFTWIFAAPVAAAVVFIVDHSVERADSSSSPRWSPMALGSMIGAVVVAILVAPPVLPIVFITVVTRLVLWIADLIGWVVHWLVRKLGPSEVGQPVPKPPSYPGVFPGP